MKSDDGSSSKSFIPCHPSSIVSKRKWVIDPILGKGFSRLPAFCLLIDILGFSRMMDKLDPEEIAVRSARFFKTCLDDFIPFGFSLKDIELLKRKFMRISDTVAMWSYTSPMTPEGRDIVSDPGLEMEALRWITSTCKHLMTVGLKEKFVLRGAASFGDCVQDMSECAIIGKPWSEAAGLERSQNWAGISLCESVSSKFSVDQLVATGNLIKWQVPLKRKDGQICRHEYQELWVIDWRSSDLTDEDIRSAFSEIPSSEKIAPSVQQKLDETLKFFLANQSIRNDK